jgi:hypothetical protein
MGSALPSNANQHCPDTSEKQRKNPSASKAKAQSPPASSPPDMWPCVLRSDSTSESGSDAILDDLDIKVDFIA